MARAHFVRSARKDHPEAGVKKGESYYWWAFMVGGRGGPKHYSKTPPKRSQLTQSEFLSALYDIEDDISASALVADDGLGDAVSDIASRLNELADETESKKENLPDGLQNGQPGDQLQERADACRAAAEELEGMSFDDKDDDESDEDFWQGKLDEVQAVSIDAS
jgi:hypothetical protein